MFTSVGSVCQCTGLSLPYRADFIPPALWSVLKSTLCFLNSVLGMLGSLYDFWDQLDECISKGRLCVAGIGCSTDQLENRCF